MSGKCRENVGESQLVRRGKPVASSEKTSEKILAALGVDGTLSIADLGSMIGVTTRSIERNIQKLLTQGRLRRIGPDQGGRWEVIE